MSTGPSFDGVPSFESIKDDLSGCVVVFAQRPYHERSPEGVAGRQEGRVTLSASEELHGRIGLAEVFFKAEWKLHIRD